MMMLLVDLCLCLGVCVCCVRENPNWQLTFALDEAWSRSVVNDEGGGGKG